MIISSFPMLTVWLLITSRQPVYQKKNFKHYTIYYNKHSDSDYQARNRFIYH